jgi:hypothetical protein
MSHEHMRYVCPFDDPNEDVKPDQPCPACHLPADADMLSIQRECINNRLHSDRNVF